MSESINVKKKVVLAEKHRQSIVDAYDGLDLASRIVFSERVATGFEVARAVQDINNNIVKLQKTSKNSLYFVGGIVWIIVVFIKFFSEALSFDHPLPYLAIVIFIVIGLIYDSRIESATLYRKLILIKASSLDLRYFHSCVKIVDVPECYKENEFEMEELIAYNRMYENVLRSLSSNRPERICKAFQETDNDNRSV